MKFWKKAVVLNLAGLLGIASSIFVVPPNTPFVFWLIISAVALAVFNAALVWRHRKAASGGSQGTSKVATVIGWVCVAFWILDVLVHVIRR
jgi:hypothetical protein